MTQHHISRVANPSKVKKIVVVGPEREFAQVKTAFSRHPPKIDFLWVNTIRQDGSKRERAEVLPELEASLRRLSKAAMVISDVGDVRPYKFEMIAQDIKAAAPGAYYALVTSRTECIGLPSELAKFVSGRGFDPSAVLPKVDYVFHYAGNPDLFPTMLSLREDSMNYRKDHERVILVVEDRPNYYSGFLTSLYGINGRRTRLLLARNFEEASSILGAAGNRLAGAIIGMRFPKASESSEEACWELLNLIKERDYGVPVIFQTASQRRLARAEGEGRVFALDKNDPGLLASLRDIMRDFFGFGDFVFRLPGKAANGEPEIARACDLSELYYLVKTIQEDSLRHHASKNHFSNWLWLHSYKKLALAIRPIAETEPNLREMLLEQMQPFVKQAK